MSVGHLRSPSTWRYPTGNCYMDLEGEEEEQVGGVDGGQEESVWSEKRPEKHPLLRGGQRRGI